MARRRAAASSGRQRRPCRAAFRSVLSSTDSCPLLDLRPEIRCQIYDRVPLRTLIVPSEGHHIIVSPLTAVCTVVRAEYLHHVDKCADLLHKSQRMLCRVQNLDFALVLALFTHFPQLASSPPSEIHIALIFNTTQLDGDSVGQWLEFLAARPMQLRIDYHPDWSALDPEEHIALHSILRVVYKMVPRGDEYQWLKGAIMGCDWPAAARDEDFCTMAFRSEKRIS